MLESLRDMLEQSKRERKTPGELKSMPTSALIMQIAVYSTDLAKLNEHKDILEELQKDQPETYSMFLKVIGCQSMNLDRVCKELDRRVPGKIAQAPLHLHPKGSATGP